MNKTTISLVATLVATLTLTSVAAQQLQLQPIPSNLGDKSQENCTLLTTKPSAETKKYVFQGNLSHPCIVAQFSVYLSTGQGQYIDFKNGTVNEALSKCDNTSAPQHLVVDFDCAQLGFVINHINESIYVAGIFGHHNNATGLPEKQFSNTTTQFNTTQSGHYYKCNSEQTIGLGSNSSLVMKNVAYEAFRDASGTEFYRIPEECTLDSQPVSDLVRIGVGVCLIALVAIVLIAYFIGRRRWSERSSYESV